MKYIKPCQFWWSASELMTSLSFATPSIKSRCALSRKSAWRKPWDIQAPLSLLLHWRIRSPSYPEPPHRSRQFKASVCMHLWQYSCSTWVCSPSFYLHFTGTLWENMKEGRSVVFAASRRTQFYSARAGISHTHKGSSRRSLPKKRINESNTMTAMLSLLAIPNSSC